MRIKGRARVDRCTKRLVARLRPGEIAIIDHEDLDTVTAESLARRRPRAVVNARRSVTGRYPNPGPLALLRAGIPVLDDAGPGLMVAIREGDEVEVIGATIRCRGEPLAECHILTREDVETLVAVGRNNFPRETLRFIQNTLAYALREAEAILGDLEVPRLATEIKGRQVLVAVRGEHCLEDLRAVRTYIRENRPVIIGVDGGADILLGCGYRPHMIIGDMDSVSDSALSCGAELVVHAYPDGYAPGLSRVSCLGLAAKVVRAPGTSEDLALLLAHQLGASLIVVVGGHSSVLDFLRKGRQGMASTLLARLKVGSCLVDAKGVSLLYRQRLCVGPLLNLLAAALASALAALLCAPVTQQLVRLAAWRLRLSFGF